MSGLTTRHPCQTHLQYPEIKPTTSEQLILYFSSTSPPPPPHLWYVWYYHFFGSSRNVHTLFSILISTRSTSSSIPRGKHPVFHPARPAGPQLDVPAARTSTKHSLLLNNTLSSKILKNKSGFATPRAPLLIQIKRSLKVQNAYLPQPFKLECPNGR